MTHIHLQRRLLLGAALGVPAGRLAHGSDPAADKVTFATAAVTMLYLPIYVADVMGYFVQQRIDAEITTFQSGATAFAAVLGGSANIYLGAPSTAISAIDRGSDAVIIGAVLTEFALDLVLNKQAAAKKGITASSTLEERLAALRGLRIGVSGAGSGTHQIAQYVLRQAKLDPERDATIVFVGSGPEMLTTLLSGRIDAVVTANPNSDLEVVKYGAVIMFHGAAGGYPGLSGTPNVVLVTTRRWAGSVPDRTQRVLEALRLGEVGMKDLSVSDQARDRVHAKYFEQIDKGIFDIAWKSVAPAFPNTPAITVEQMSRNLAFLREFSDARYRVAPEKVFTNQYIKPSEP